MGEARGLASLIRLGIAVAGAVCAATAFAASPDAPGDTEVLTGARAFGDWRTDAPGVRRLIRPQDVPPPYATPSVANVPNIVARPADAWPKVPPGFKASIFAEGLDSPRTLLVAPNGDIFVAESGAGRIVVLRPGAGGDKPVANEVFAADLRLPYGLAFYPSGADPKYLYVGDTDAVLRFPYAKGDTKARGAPETIVADLPAGPSHWTRDLAFSLDGRRMFVSVGSESNDADAMPRMSADEIRAFQANHALGATWDNEARRADVLVFDPDGDHGRVFATGLRNCSTMRVQPVIGALWCGTNERDYMGDNFPPDFVTRVREGQFYGWPWYAIGSREDPRHKGERPDLAGKVTMPDVLLQAHSAPLGLAFYDGDQFPPAFKGDAFVVLQGSMNRAKRTGYKLVRLLLKDGAPTGVYEDFMTGMILSDTEVWVHPVGIAVTRDGALLFGDEDNGTIWRIAYRP